MWPLLFTESSLVMMLSLIPLYHSYITAHFEIVIKTRLLHSLSSAVGLHNKGNGLLKPFNGSIINVVYGAWLLIISDYGRLGFN